MGTESIIMVVGDRGNPGVTPDYTGAIRLYRHYDGHPETILQDIAAAINRMSALVDNSSEWKTAVIRRYGIDPMACTIMAESVSNLALGVEMEENFIGKPAVKQLGNQGGVQWVYVVDCLKQLVNIYSTKQPTMDNPEGQYSGQAKEHLSAGIFVSWDVHIEEYTDEFRETVRKNIAIASEGVKGAGWKLCEESDPYLALVEKANGKKAQLFDAEKLKFQTPDSAWNW